MKFKPNCTHQKSKRAWICIAASLLCVALLLSAIILIPSLLKNRKQSSADAENNSDAVNGSDSVVENKKRTDIPLVKSILPSQAPKYYGDESSIYRPAPIDYSEIGLSVIAEFEEELPDIYTFFDDWRQYEFKLLRMSTKKLLVGQEMTEEFYYLVPIEFYTDFSVYDSFIIKEMGQFTYEYSVVYNKTQDRAERLDMVVFAYSSAAYHFMGENVMAFDSDGNFDRRLWKANDAWIERTQKISAPDTISQTEEDIIATLEYDFEMYVHLLEDASPEEKKLLADMKASDVGVFVPTCSSKLGLSPEIQFLATKYINGFATNESVRLQDETLFTLTKASFDNEDMANLPDLTSAFEAVAMALENGTVTPPHIEMQEARSITTGVFGWYAKTEKGVIGVVRVNWCFDMYSKQFYDDAYYIIEYGSGVCKAIDRDDLLELFGEYETTYVYSGEYYEFGKHGNGIYKNA